MSDNVENWWNDSLACAAFSDVGMRRASNQDAFFANPASTPQLWSSRGHLFLVADGMGAHLAGERASELASTIVPQSYYKRTDQTTLDALRDAILEAHKTIREVGRNDESCRDMGTTCDVLALKPDGAYIGHVGDSRVYRLRGLALEQLTFDHSLFWEVRARCSSNPAAQAQLENVPKNYITRSLGPTENLVVALEGPFQLFPGDVFLLCSDGLSGQLGDSEIAQTLALLQPKEAAEALVNLANINGGPDNITVVVVRVKNVPDRNGTPIESNAEDKASSKKGLAKAFAIGSGVSFLLAGLSLFSGYRAVLGTLFICLACVLLGAFRYFARKEGFSPKTIAAKIKRSGKAPYARVSARPNKEFCDYVDDKCAQLCADIKARPDLFAPDWKGIENARSQARAFIRSQNYADALRANLSVVNYIMRELKKVGSVSEGETGR